MIFKTLVVCLFACVTLGCQNAPRSTPSNDPKSDEKMIYVKPKLAYYKEPWSSEGIDIPNWINDPSIDGKYNASVGSCFKEGLSFTEYRNKAYEAAVSELGRSKGVKVKSVYKSYETGDGISYVEDTAKLESIELVKNAQIASAWDHPVRKEYYVWVIVK